MFLHLIQIIFSIPSSVRSPINLIKFLLPTFVILRNHTKNSFHKSKNHIWGWKSSKHFLLTFRCHFLLLKSFHNLIFWVHQIKTGNEFAFFLYLFLCPVLIDWSSSQFSYLVFRFKSHNTTFVIELQYVFYLFVAGLYITCFY